MNNTSLILGIIINLLFPLHSKTGAIVVEEYMTDVLNVVTLSCQQLLGRVDLIGTKGKCAADLREPCCTIVYAAPYLDDQPELMKVRAMLLARFGNKFPNECVEDTAISPKVVTRLKREPPDTSLVNCYISAIAKENNIPGYDTSSLIPDDLFPDLLPPQQPPQLPELGPPPSFDNTFSATDPSKCSARGPGLVDGVAGSTCHCGTFQDLVTTAIIGPMSLVGVHNISHQLHPPALDSRPDAHPNPRVREIQPHANIHLEAVEPPHHQLPAARPPVAHVADQPPPVHVNSVADLRAVHRPAVPHLVPHLPGRGVPHLREPAPLVHGGGGARGPRREAPAVARGSDDAAGGAEGVGDAHHRRHVVALDVVAGDGGVGYAAKVDGHVGGGEDVAGADEVEQRGREEPGPAGGPAPRGARRGREGDALARRRRGGGAHAWCAGGAHCVNRLSLQLFWVLIVSKKHSES
ncbi:P-type ATPase [Pelomyxa schiedti]|nr:P-type ATPase [Pelomyxa schiedti]